MKKLLLVFLTINCYAQAPAIEWQKCYGGASNDRGFCILETTDGGYIFTGNVLSDDGDVSVNHGNADVWVVKTNSIGEILWEKTFGGISEDFGSYIQQTTDGGYVITGTTLSNNNDFPDNHGLRDVFVIRLNSEGNVVWKKCFGGTSREYGEGIQQTSDGGYIVVGRTTSDDGDVATNLGNYDCWVFKLNALGILEWEKVYGGTYDDFGFSVMQTADSGFVVSGYTNSIDGNSIGNHSGLYDCLILKLDQIGNVQWQKVIGGILDDTCYSIIETLDGGFVGAGYSSSSEGDLTTNNGNYDALAFKLGATGTLLWIKTFGDGLYDAFIDVKETSNNNYVFSGFYNGLSISSGNSQCWAVKLNSEGDLVWDTKLGGTGFDTFYHSSFTSNNSLISIGYTNSNDINVSGNHGNNDFWVVKFLPEQLSILSFEKNTFTIYPNPTEGIINLELPENSIKKIKVINFLGEVIVEQIGKKNQINVENLSNGIYIMEVISEYNQYKTKFIKQ